MTLTIHLADELEQQLEQEASRFGLSMEHYSAQILARHLEEERNHQAAVDILARINVTDVTALRKVSRLLLDLAGTQLYGEKPSLVAGHRPVWRVPVWLGLPTVGPVGQVATLDVDTQTGEVLYTKQLLDEIVERGNVLAGSIGPVTPEKYGRAAGLHTGAMRMSADFNAPLPDEFWLGGE